MFRPSWAVIEELQVQYNSTYPHAGYPDRLGHSGKFVENSSKLIALKLLVIGSSTVLWLLELQTKRRRKV